MRKDSRTWFCVLSALAVACGSDDGQGAPDAGGINDGGRDAVTAADAVEPDAAAPVDPSEALFRPDHILEIDITLAAADWAVLREQPESLDIPKSTCSDPTLERAYTYFPGEITIDGVTVSEVGVRKKGGFGSSSSTRPALKIKANEYVSGQRIFGLKRLTLNNNKQDRPQINQCLGYGLFSAAGIPASRCSFAHVTVNGEDLGLYSNVESIKQNFLARHFEDETGRLYESGGDFRTGETGRFQPKVDRENPDCSDLAAVVSALHATNPVLLEALDPVVDIDAFMTYWAMEVITDHWDGYANNRNNYFFYHDPTSDKFHFIPWGIDQLFEGRERTTRPDSVFACGNMAWQLYDAPEARALYLAKLRELLDSVWDESAILAEITRMQALITPIADPTNSGELAEEIDKVREFVSTRRATLLAELDAGTPVWPYPEGNESCWINLGSLTGTFDTTWDTLDIWDAGTGTLDGTIGGVSLTSSNGVSSAGLYEIQGIIRLLAWLDDGRLGVVQMIIQDPANVAPGTRPIDLVNVAAFMSFYDPETDTSSGGGLILNGSLTLTSASTVSGAPIVGSITGDVYEI